MSSVPAAAGSAGASQPNPETPLNAYRSSSAASPAAARGSSGGFSGGGHRQMVALLPAKAKLEELFQFWLQRQDTVEMLRKLAAEAVADAVGLTMIDDDDEVVSPAEDAAAGPASIDALGPAASPPNGATTNNPRRGVSLGRSDTEVNIAVSMEDLPTDLGGFSLARSAQPSGANNKRAVPDDYPVSPGRHGHTSPTRTPREGTKYLAVVDEMDLAHRMGALSPRSISPNISAAADGAARSPFDMNLRSPRVAPLETNAAVPPKSRSPSPHNQASGHGTSPPIAPTGVAATVTDDSDRENTPRPLGSSGPRRRSANSSLASSFCEIPQQRPPVATLTDIPTFYFPRGRPATARPSLFDDASAGRGNVTYGVLAPPFVRPPGAQQPLSQPSAITNPIEDREISAIQRIVANANVTSLGKKTAGIAGRLASASKGRPTTGGGSHSADVVLLQVARQLCTDAFGLPHVLAPLVVPRVVRQPGNTLTFASVRAFYDTCLAKHGEVRRIFETLLGSSPQAPAQDKNGQRRNFLVRDDFIPLLHALIEYHPGLAFLKEATDFQSKYIDTVVLRIFYDADPRDTGRITWEAFAHSELPRAIRQLALTDEINQVLAYFSYEHFYVLYCRFWELDSDKDLHISAADLARYFPEGTANDIVIERIFAGAGRKLQCRVTGKMNYDDFVFFCMSEEDKTTARALTYWFRILDLDGDGVLSGHELSAVYEMTRARLEQITGESIAFPDAISQITDMLRGPSAAPRGAGSVGLLSSPPSTRSVFAQNASTVSGLDLINRLRRQGSRPPSPAAPNAVIPPAPQTQTASSSKPPQAGGGRSTSSRSLAANITGTTAESLSALGFTLADFLQRPQAASVAVSMLTNVAKFLQYEQRDPFVVNHERSQTTERNDWDRFCRAEYDRMSLSEEEG